MKIRRYALCETCRHIEAVLFESRTEWYNLDGSLFDHNKMRHHCPRATPTHISYIFEDAKTYDAKNCKVGAILWGASPENSHEESSVSSARDNPSSKR
jgi:hypothetical protein